LRHYFETKLKFQKFVRKCFLDFLTSIIIDMLATSASHSGESDLAAGQSVPVGGREKCGPDGSLGHDVESAKLHEMSDTVDDILDMFLFDKDESSGSEDGNLPVGDEGKAGDHVDVPPIEQGKY
jgi:hypothetical protein